MGNPKDIGGDNAEHIMKPFSRRRICLEPGERERDSEMESHVARFEPCIDHYAAVLSRITVNLRSLCVHSRVTKTTNFW